MPDLFDMRLRAMRRDRAARLGPELFLFDRAFEDCVDRLAAMDRKFEHALISCPQSAWNDRLGAFAETVDCLPQSIVEDAWHPPEAAYDLVLSVGALDTVDDLPLALRLLRFAMRPGALLLGAVSGGDTLPQLRSAMRAGDELAGAAAPRVHPRIEPSSLAPLLGDAGFIQPVVDVDRVKVGYRSFDHLLRDLRAMGSTNILTRRGPPMTRRQRQAAVDAFAAAAENGRTVETFEILHFAAWTPSVG